MTNYLFMFLKFGKNKISKYIYIYIYILSNLSVPYKYKTKTILIKYIFC